MATIPGDSKDWGFILFLLLVCCFIMALVEDSHPKNPNAKGDDTPIIVMSDE